MGGRFQIQTMSQEQVSFAIEMAAQEGWNPGLHDARAFYAADPNGFLIGLLDNRPIGCISAVSYGTAQGGSPFGFVGFYVVVPEQRGRGYGIQLWRRAIAYLAKHSVGLDGVVEQPAKYQKSGFKLAYRNIRFMGVAKLSSGVNVNIVEIASLPIEQLCHYDMKFFPAQRREFLQSWIARPESKAVAFVEDGGIRGYGMIRRCVQGYRIGPLFADRDVIAEAILEVLASYAAGVATGSPIYMDVPEANPAALAMAARHGMSQVFETARMYTGDAPAIVLGGIYGVTTLELG
jgi:hypothetical protein